MPEIPRYESKTAAAGELSYKRVDPSAAGAGDMAMARTIGEIGQISVEMGKKLADMQAVQQYGNVSVGMQKQLMDLHDGITRSPEFIADPASAERKFLEGAEKIQQGFQGQISNPKINMQLQSDFSHHTMGYVSKLRGAAFKQQATNASADLLTNYQSLLDMSIKSGDGLIVAQSKDKFSQLVAGYVATRAIQADVGVQMVQSFRKEVDTGLFHKVLAEKDGQAALQALDMLGDIPEKEKPRLREMAQHRIERDEARAEAAANKLEAEKNRTVRFIGGKLDDAVATMAEMGEEGPNDYESKLRELGTEQALDLADKYRDQKRLALDTFKVVKGMEHLPLMEQADQVKRMFTVSAGEPGAKERIRAGEMAERVVNERIKRFSADPATYVQPMTQTLMTPGASQEEQISISMGLQNEIAKGVPGFSPRVFATDAGKKLKDEWDKMPADGRLSFTESLDAYGKYKGQALSELGLGAGAQFAAVASNADFRNRMLARTLISAADMKEADIPGDPKTKETIKKDMRSAMESNDVMRAMMGVSRYQPANGAHLTFMSDLQKGLVNTALASGDAKKAIAILDQTYDAVSKDDLAFIFYPKNSGLKSSQIESALETIRKSRSADWVKTGEPYLQGKFLEERVRDLQNRGVWVNSPDGNGFVLLNPSTGLAVEGSKIDIDALKKEYFEPRGKGYQMDLPVDTTGNKRFPIPKPDSPVSHKEGRLNNLGNIRASSTSFRTYDTPEEGAAAAAQLLQRGYRNMTLLQIANKWAPASDGNNPAHWAKVVGKVAGLKVDEVPNLDDPGTMAKLLKGISTIEKEDPARFSDNVIMRGLSSIFGPSSASAATIPKGK